MSPELFSLKHINKLSNTQAMKQLGNSVAIPAIQAIDEEIINALS